MIRNHVVVIPTYEGRTEICDYILQTAKVLSDQNYIFIIELGQSKNIFTFLSDLISYLFLTDTSNKRIHYLPQYHFFPFRRFAVINSLNKNCNYFLCKTWINLSFPKNKKILWIFNPQFVGLISTFRSYIKIYDIIDFFTSPKSDRQQHIKKSVKSLLRSADIVTAISTTLRQQYQKIWPREIAVVPQGFNKLLFTHFKKVKHRDKKKNKVPIIGFIGGINARLDFNLLISVVKSCPQYYFYLVGPLQHDENVSADGGWVKNFQTLLREKNVFWITQQPKFKVPFWISRFDVCIIPYDMKYEFNRYCYPMKLFEYFFLGKPVVSTPILELKNFAKLIKIESTASGWKESIQVSLQKTHTQTAQEKRKLALANTWHQKLEAISREVEKLNQ